MNDGELESKPSLGDRKTPRKREAKKSHAVEKGFDVTETDSFAEAATGSAGTPTRNTKGLKVKQSVSKPSGIASTLAEHKSSKSSARSHDADLTHFDSSPKPYDMSSLSRSLPDQHDNVFGGLDRQATGSKGEDNSEVWDMPPKSASEALNVSKFHGDSHRRTV
jgi:hypothetical protein